MGRKRGRIEEEEERASEMKGSITQLDGANLEEAADVDFVVRVHEDHVLKQPEERPWVFLFGLQKLKDPVVFKEEPASALCWREKGITAERKNVIIINSIEIGIPK